MTVLRVQISNDAPGFTAANMANMSPSLRERLIRLAVRQAEARFYTPMSLPLADANWQIVMLGPVVKIDPASLPRAANIHWLGLLPPAEN